MKPNLAAWQSLSPSQKTPNQQTYALQVFTLAWNQLMQLCENPQLGSAGTGCIADRQRGGKWDWWAYYYDPIAKDPAVAANVAAAGAGSSTISPTTGTNPIDSTVSSVSQALGGISPLWIGLGIIAAAFMVSD